MIIGFTINLTENLYLSYVCHAISKEVAENQKMELREQRIIFFKLIRNVK